MSIDYNYANDNWKNMNDSQWDFQRQISICMMGMGMRDLKTDDDIDEFIKRQIIMEKLGGGNWNGLRDDEEKRSNLREGLKTISGFGTNIPHESTRKFITRISKSYRDLLIRKYCDRKHKGKGKQ